MEHINNLTQKGLAQILQKNIVGVSSEDLKVFFYRCLLGSRRDLPTHLGASSEQLDLRHSLQLTEFELFFVIVLGYRNK